MSQSKNEKCARFFSFVNEWEEEIKDRLCLIGERLEMARFNRKGLVHISEVFIGEDDALWKRGEEGVWFRGIREKSFVLCLLSIFFPRLEKYKKYTFAPYGKVQGIRNECIIQFIGGESIELSYFSEDPNYWNMNEFWEIPSSDVTTEVECLSALQISCTKSLELASFLILNKWNVRNWMKERANERGRYPEEDFSELFEFFWRKELNPDSYYKLQELSDKLRGVISKLRRKRF